MRALLRILVASVGLMGCDGEIVDSAEAPVPLAWEVRVSPVAPDAVLWTADDLERYLVAMGRRVTRLDRGGELRCRTDRGQVALLGEGLGEPQLPVTANEQTWRVEEERCGAGVLVRLSGGGVLGRQYAAYEWLHRRGVRFFHPEEEIVPDTMERAPEPFVRQHTPAFPVRSVSLHLTHPLELGDAFRLGRQEHFDEALRYIDWQLKNGASRGHGGVGVGPSAHHGIVRGFPRTSGLNLHNAQQGGRPVIDPDDPRSEEAQIEEAILAIMEAPNPPEEFSFQFNPSEFTEIPDTDAVRQMTFVADFFAEHYPDVRVYTTNHGTAGPPTETYGVRFYDLSQFAPDNLGVKVHTLMFYDLERPAPVYGNEDFHNLFDFMESEYQRRRLWYFPESAWWLTFDNAVPLYLPVTIEARDRDIQAISFMLEGGLEGHHVFGSGHEWGYWQNEYCSFRMAADLDYRYGDCLADIAQPMGEAAGEVVAVLEDTIALQATHMFDPELLAYMVGTDPETEIAASVGIVFHPLPPSPPEILGWDEARVAAFDDAIRPALERLDDRYAALALRLDAVEGEVPERARNVFDEIRDGIEVTGLRARHAWQIYGALVELRRAQLTLGAREPAEALLEDALATTDQALAVIHRREAGYRYRPLERSIGGGPGLDEDDNWTIYRYRVHARAHHGYYYTRIDELAREAFEGSVEPVVLDDALIGPGEEAHVTVTDAALEAATVDWGDGAVDDAVGTVSHAYAAPGYVDVAVRGTRAGEAFEVVLPAAALSVEHRTGFTGRIVEPENADLIEPVMPGLVLGPVADGTGAVGFDTTGTGRVHHRLWSRVELVVGSGATLATAPADLNVPIVTRSTGAVMTQIAIRRATAEISEPTGPLVLRGDLPTDEIVRAVVAIGGFDEAGARRVVASTLGYTPDDLPDELPFRVEYDVE